MSRTITIDQTAVDAVAAALTSETGGFSGGDEIRELALFLLNAAHTAQNGDDLATLRDLAAQMDTADQMGAGGDRDAQE